MALLQALLAAVPTRTELERAALAAHCAVLSHGFLCSGLERPAEAAAGGAGSSAAPKVALKEDGSAALELLPAGWNSQPDAFSFCYVHPLRAQGVVFELKAVAVGGNLAVHAASSDASSELLQVTLKADEQMGAGSDQAQRAAGWHDQVSNCIAVRLLLQQAATKRLGQCLDVTEAEGAGRAKRPATQEDGQARRGGEPAPRFDPRFGDPTPEGGPPGRLIGDPEPLLWYPDGGLIGPRHPAWGQPFGMRPRGGVPGSGWMPRFDPVGPGGMDPDPDHLRVPGVHPDFEAAFQGGAMGGGGLFGGPRGSRGGPHGVGGPFMM